MPQLNRCPQGTIIKFNRCDGTPAQDGDKFVRCEELPPFATPAETIAGTATNLIVNPADLYARENLPAQTGLSNDVTAIPAPTASQSTWGVNQLGETLHYAPALGWQIVDKRYSVEATYPDNTSVTDFSFTPVGTFVAPRNGTIAVDFGLAGLSGVTGGSTIIAYVLKNGAIISENNNTYNLVDNGLSAHASTLVNVVAGDVISFHPYWIFTSVNNPGVKRVRSAIAYIN